MHLPTATRPIASRRTARSRAPLDGLVALAVLALGGAPAAGQGFGTRVYTSDADFDGGLMLNVNHASSGQLELDRVAAPLPYVDVACSGRGTLVRIDVDSGAVVGEYLTAPDQLGRDPSRTTVDRLGNVWVCNRAEAGLSRGQARGSVARVGIVIGGTRGKKNAHGEFVPDPEGEYLRPPFRYSTCIDRDGDGLIRTSRGLGNVLAWPNTDGANTDGGVSTAEDECILDFTRIVGTNARTVAIDANNDVWTGGLGNQAHEKLSGLTGLPIEGTQFNVLAGGYGGLVDGRGVLWSARGGNGLVRYDPATRTSTVLGNDCGDYGLAIDPVTGNVWHTGLTTGRVSVRDPEGNCIGSYPYGSDSAQGLAVDGRGNVWIAHSLLGPSTTVGHLRTDGTFVGNVPLTHANGNGSGPTGVAVDSHGKLWVACYYSNNALRIDPSAGLRGGGGFPIGAVDRVVDLGAGATPYNYSDMTGFVAIGTTAPAGTWSKIEDSSVVGQAWGELAWNSREPAGTSVTVEARAADSATALPSKPFVRASNGRSLGDAGVRGRFLELRATLARRPDIDALPVLFELSVASGSPSGPTLQCPADFTEVWNGGAVGEQLDPSRTGRATYSDACAQGAKLEFSDTSVAGAVPGAPQAIVTRRWRLSDACGGEMSCEQTLTLLSPTGQTGALTLDIAPGQCPNGVDVRGSGTTKIALVGTWLHEVSSVDVGSLHLQRTDGVGTQLALASLPIAFEDVTRPFYGASSNCHALGGEGHVDAVISVPNWMLRRAFDLDGLAPDTSVELELTGRLRDGPTFAARDSLRVQ